MSLRLLLIEDSATVRKLVEICARKRAFTLEAVATGAEGISRALSNPPDVILLDFMLPDMEGVQVCEALAHNPRAAGVPTLIASAKGPRVLKRFERFPSVQGLLPKPFSEAELLESLRRLAPGGLAEAVTAAPASAPQARAGVVEARAAGTAVARPVPAAASAYRGGAQPTARDAQATHPLAQALAEALRGQLAQIPALELRRGDAPAAEWYAQKLLTPAVVAELLRRLPELQPATPGSELPSSKGQWGALVLDRAPRFNERLSASPLPARERRVLALVDGQRTVADISLRAALPLPDLQPVLRGLISSGILVRVGESAGAAPLKPSQAARSVAVVVDSDLKGFVQPLARLCSALENPFSLVSSTIAEAAAVVARRAPQMTLVAAPRFEELVALGPTLRPLLGPPARLVALLAPAQFGSDESKLFAAGYDSVLQKPIAEELLQRMFKDCPARVAG